MKAVKKLSLKSFIGIDLHSTQFTCHFLTRKKGFVKRQFPVSEAGIHEFLDMVPEESAIMVEASTGTFTFCKKVEMHKNIKKVVVGNTHKLKWISMDKVKTDKIDAKKLATILKIQEISGEEMIKPVYIPKDEIKQLRSLFTTERLLIRDIVRFKNRIHSLYKQNLLCIKKGKLDAKTKRESYLDKFALPECEKMQVVELLKMLKSIEESLSVIEDNIKIIGAKYYIEIDILTSMKGISIISALAVIADIGDIKRFPSAKNLTSYLRSTPSVDSSNDKTKIGKTNKFSRKLAISKISQSIQHFTSADPKLKSWYETKGAAKGKGKMRMAVVRKIFTQMYYMLSRNEYHYQKITKNHQNKMNTYTNFLIRKKVNFVEAITM
ncbi:MAG: IS110 family transposase [Bacteroidales bacterium]|nr:IS110 family transposase [Bacteroidales bacterium]